MASIPPKQRAKPPAGRAHRGRAAPAPSHGRGRKAYAAIRKRFEGSVAQTLVVQLRDLDFADQAILFGAGLLVSLLPFLILLSAFASNRIDDDIALRLGLDRRAAGLVTHLFRSSPASLNVATATSLVFVTVGSVAVAGSLQQIYEKAFHEDHLGMRGLYRLPIWIVMLCVTVMLETVIGRPARSAPAGAGLAGLVTFAVMTPFFWWTAHFLLAGRVPWRALLPCATATGFFFAGLGVFSRFYFSATIITDSRTYGAIGAVFGIMTWFVAIGAVIILGAVTGAVWDDRRRRSAHPPRVTRPSTGT